MAVGFGGEIPREDAGATVREEAVLSRAADRGTAVVAVVIAAVVLPLRPCPGRGPGALDGSWRAPIDSDTRRFPTGGCAVRRGEGTGAAESRALAIIRGVADVVWV
jgi:hypothetical protein